MLEEIRKNLDKGRFSGMLLTDLSKAFDCLVHDLLIAKLNAYGFDYNALSLINSYLSDRKQRTKILLLLQIMQTIIRPMRAILLLIWLFQELKKIQAI